MRSPCELLIALFKHVHAFSPIKGQPVLEKRNMCRRTQNLFSSKQYSTQGLDADDEHNVSISLLDIKKE